VRALSGLPAVVLVSVRLAHLRWHWEDSVRLVLTNRLQEIPAALRVVLRLEAEQMQAAVPFFKVKHEELQVGGVSALLPLVEHLGSTATVRVGTTTAIARGE